MSPIRLRPATAGDFAALPEMPIAFWGIVAERDGATIAMGSIVWKWEARLQRMIAWGSFDAAERPPAIMMHRWAIRTLKAAQAAGEPDIFALCDRHIAGAVRWLRRLGFRRDAQMSALYRQAVYRWQP